MILHRQIILFHRSRSLSATFGPFHPYRHPPSREIVSKWQAVHHNIVAFGIAQPELSAWEAWLSQQGILIELRKTWRYDGEAIYFRDSDDHLLEVATPGAWSIYSGTRTGGEESDGEKN
jgi:catechol 2,3-dioxygenase-like lactoylglutathione lyase family enzyme